MKPGRPRFKPSFILAEFDFAFDIAKRPYGNRMRLKPLGGAEPIATQATGCGSSLSAIPFEAENARQGALFRHQSHIGWREAERSGGEPIRHFGSLQECVWEINDMRRKEAVLNWELRS